MVKVEGYKQFGGKHPETTVVRHVLRFSGFPISEEMIFGLSGGISFVYWFMKCMPAPIQAMKYADSRENPVAAAVKRLGGEATIKESGSEKRAFKLLLDVLREGRPAICWGDPSLLPYMASAGPWRYAPHVFVVYEMDEEADRVLIADRGRFPFEITVDQLASARGSKLRPYPARNRMADLRAPESLDKDLFVRGIWDAVRATHERMIYPPITNLGLKGIKKWANLVLKWPKQFPGKKLFGCLHNILVLLDTCGTGGGGFRKMYAGFLKDAGVLTGDQAFKGAAAAFRTSAGKVDSIIQKALPDEWPALKRYRELAFERKRCIEDNTPEANAGLARLTAKQEKAIKKAEDEVAARDTAPLIEGLHRAVLDFLSAEIKACDMLGRLVQ